MEREERREFIKAAAIEAMGAFMSTDTPHTIEDCCVYATNYAVQLSKEIESALNAEDL